VTEKLMGEKLVAEIIVPVVKDVAKKHGLSILKEWVGRDYSDLESRLALKSFRIGNDVIPADAQRESRLLRAGRTVAHEPTKGIPKITVRVDGSVFKVTMDSVRAFLRAFLDGYERLWSEWKTMTRPIILPGKDGKEERFEVTLAEMPQKIAEAIGEKDRRWYEFASLVKKFGAVVEGKGTFTMDDVIKFYKYIYEVDGDHTISRLQIRVGDVVYSYQARIEALLHGIREVLPKPAGGTRERNFYEILKDKAEVFELVVGKRELSKDDVVNNVVALVLGGLNVVIGLGERVKYRAGRVVARATVAIPGRSRKSVSPVLGFTTPVFTLDYKSVVGGNVNIEGYRVFLNELIDKLVETCKNNVDVLKSYYDNLTRK